MYTDIPNYFYQTVITSFHEYVEESNERKAGKKKDTRKAINASTALYHLREHLVAPNKLSWTEAVALCPEYALLGDVVNAAKHKHLTKPSPIRKLSHAKQIEEMVVITLYEDKDGEYHSVEKTIMLTLDGGSQRPLIEVMVAVVNFWQEYLYSKRLIENVKPYYAPDSSEPKSREQCGSNRFDFEIIRGLAFQNLFYFQKYDYTTKTVFPVDISKNKFEMKIYKPEVLSIVLTFKNPQTNKKFNKKVTLTKDESQNVRALKTDSERQSYVSSLIKIQKAWLALIKKSGHTVILKQPDESAGIQD